MSNNKQTAVEWLTKEISNQLGTNSLLEELFKQAKEIEKRQIMQAYALGHVFHDSNDSNAPEFYYNTEYGKQ